MAGRTRQQLFPGQGALKEVPEDGRTSRARVHEHGPEGSCLQWPRPMLFRRCARPRDLPWGLQSTDRRCTHIDTLPTVNPVEAALR